MNGKKAKRLRREAKFKPDAEAKDFRFKFPGLAKSIRFPVFKRNAGTGNVITNMKGQPLHYEFEDVTDEETNITRTQIKTEIMPIQKAVSLKQSGRAEKATYRRLKRGKPDDSTQPNTGTGSTDSPSGGDRDSLPARAGGEPEAIRDRGDPDSPDGQQDGSRVQG